MKIEAIKNELFKMLSIEKEAYYKGTDLKEQNKSSEEYAIFKDYYLKILNNDSFSYVYKLKDDLINESKNLENKYKELLNDYNNQDDEKLKSQLAKIVNSYVYKIDAYNKTYNIINNNLKDNDDNSLEYSNKIINLIINNKEDNNYEIYRLNDERRTRLIDMFGSNVIKYITKLESLEQLIARVSNDIIEPYKIDKKTYIASLKDTINAINDYYYLDTKNSKYYKKSDDLYIHRFNLYVRKYHSLIKSLFKNEFHIIETEYGKISTNELLNYLEIYNIDGIYEVFISKNKGRVIGNNELNKKDYLDNIEMINKYINKLIEDANIKFKTKNITIVDNNSREELINERNELLKEIYLLKGKE